MRHCKYQVFNAMNIVWNERISKMSDAVIRDDKSSHTLLRCYSIKTLNPLTSSITVWSSQWN